MKRIYLSWIYLLNLAFSTRRENRASRLFFVLLLMMISFRSYADPCTVEAGNNVAICIGSSTTLNAIASGGSGSFTYYWSSVPPGSPAWHSTLQNPTVNPTVNTIYTVVVTDISNPLCNATDQVTVTVNPLPAPNITGPTGCAFSPGYQYTTANVTGHTYVWTVSGGSITSGQNTNTITVFWNAFGTGTVSVTETITATGCSKMASKSIAIHNVPVANFTPPPPSSFGCSSVPITFTDGSTSTDGTVNQWYWDFGNPGYPNNTSTLRNPSHTFTANGVGSQSFNIKLVATTSWGCKDTVVKQLTVLQSPDPSIDDANPVPTDKWRHCVGSGGPTHTLVINNISATEGTNTHYHIEWGDPNDPTPYDDVTLPDGTSHTYTSIDNFEIVVTVTNAQCSNSKTYYFFNGSNPSGGIVNPGNTTGLCGLPQKVTFSFSPNTANNPPGTTYDITFDDNTSITIDQPPPASVTHYYTTCSCGHTSQFGSPNAFGIKCITHNPCGSSNSMIDPIEISTKPDADFTISPMNADSTACSNTTITFTATSLSCGYVDPLTHDCSMTLYSTWSVTPATGWSLVSPSTLTSSPLTLNFTTPGNYAIKLISSNGCGNDTVIRHICISPTPVASFTTSLNPASGCLPLTVNITNNSTTTDPCGTVSYTWSISNYSGSNDCPPNANGSTCSDIHAATPFFTFTNPGVYTIRLVVQDKCNTTNTTQTVTVNDVPHLISLTTAPSPICAGGGSTPEASFSNCNTSITGYSWTFEGSPATSDQQNPGAILYSTPGTKQITVKATNVCGDSPIATTSLVVKPLANPTITGDPTPCLNDTVTYTTEQGNTGYTWIANGGTIIGASNTYLVKVKWTSTGAKTLTVNYQLNGCPALAATVYNITVVPLPVPTITGPQSVCEGTTGVIYSTEAGMTGYSWTITGGTITSGQSTNQVLVTWPTPGVKTICVTYNDANGCKAAAPTCLQVTVNSLPVPTITPADDPLTVCINSSTQFTTEPGMLNYSWIPSPGATIASGQGTNSVIVNWPNLGAQSISVTYTDLNTCTPAIPTTKTIHVVPLASPTISGPASVCKDSAYTYTTEPGMGNYNWTTSAGGTIQSGQGTGVVKIFWGTTGTQWVKVNYENQACPAPQPTQYVVTVNARPVISVSGGTIFCADTSGVDYSTAAGMTGYVWNISSGGEILTGMGTNHITVKWNTAGANWVSVNYQNAAGCPASVPTVLPVTIHPRPLPAITGELSPCTGSNYIYSTEAGMTGYSWTISPGGTIISGSGTSQVTISWNGTGSQSLCVTYKNTFGCPASTPTCQNINVIDLPAPTITGPDSTCVNKTETYCTQPGMNNYIWAIGPNGLITGGTGTNCITVSWPTPGQKTISVNYSQAGCPATSPAVKNVKVNDRPSPSLASNNSNLVCAGSNDNTYTTEAGKSGYTWSISPGGTIVSGGGTGDHFVTLLWTTTGAKTVCVNYIDPLTNCDAAAPVCLNVTVKPIPVISITGESAPCNLTTCTYTTQPGMSEYAWGINGGNKLGGGTATDDYVTVQWTTPGPQWVSINYVNADNCTQPSPVVYPVNVKPVPVGSANPSTLMVCSTESFLIDLISDLGASTSFSWSVSHPSLTGQSIGFTDPIMTSYINPGTTPADAVFTIVPTNAGCAGNSFTATVTVNPVPQVITTPLSQTISSGQQTLLVPLTTNVSGGPVTCQIAGTANPPNITGLLTPGSYTDIPPHVLINPNDINGTVTYNITPSINSCPGPSVNYVITIEPTANAGVDPATQTLCSGTMSAPVTLSSTVSGTTFSWSATTIPSGFSVPVPSGIGSPIPAQAIINSNNVAGTVIFTVIPSLNGVAGTPMTCEIIVNPKPVILFTPATQVLCSGSPSATITLSSGVSGTTFGWRAAASGPIVPGTFPAAGNGDIPSMEIKNSGIIPGAVTLHIGASTSAGCIGDTVPSSITVNPRPAVQESILSQQVCSGGATAQVNLTSNIPTATFSWYAVASYGNLTGYTASGTGNIPPQNIINPNLTAETVTYYIFAISQFGPPCNGDTITHTVTVVPRPEMTCNPVNQSICTGGTSLQVDFAADITGTTYTWNGSSPSGIHGYITPGTTAFIPSQSTIVNTSNLPGDVDYVITPWYDGCDGTPVNSIITVNPGPAIINSTDTETICSGESTTGVTFVSTVANAGYKWAVSSVTPTVPPLSGYPVSGFGDLPTMVLLNNSFEISTLTYHVLPFILNSATDTCFGVSFYYSITVNPLPDVIANPVSPQTVCSGAPPTATVALTSHVQGTAFTWIALNPPSELSNFIVSGSGDIPSQVIYNSSSDARFLVYTITPVANGCPGPTAEYTIQVNPLPLISFDPPGQAICSGETTLPVTISSSVAGTSFSWSASSVPGVTGYTLNGAGAIIPGQTIFNLNNTLCQVVFTITASASGCSGLTYQYVIDVSPRPSVTNDPMGDTLCSGGTSGLVILTSNVAGTSFSWVSLPGPGTSGATSNGGNIIPPQTLYNAFNTPGYVDYAITPTSHLGKECSGSTVNYRIVVLPEPHITNTILSQETCSGELTDEVILTSDVSGTIFEWTSSAQNASGNTPSGTGNIPPETLVTTNPSGGSVTYTIYPTVGNCAGIPKDYVIHVKPMPQITNTLFSQILCSGEATNILVTTDLPGVQISWTASLASGSVTGFSPAGMGNPIQETLVNTGIVPGVVAYKVIATLENCSSTPVFFFVTVNPAPTADFTYLPVICLGEATHFYDASVSHAQNALLTREWNFDDPASGSDSISLLQNPTHIFSSAGVYHVRLVVTDTEGCRDTVIRSLFFNPAPVADFSYSGQCHGTPTQFTDLSSIPTGTIVSWDWNFGDPVTGLMNTSTQRNPVHDFSAPGTYSVTLIVHDNNLCMDSIVRHIVIHPSPVADFSFPSTCVDTIAVFHDLSSGPSSPIILWEWDFGDSQTISYTLFTDPVTHLYSNSGQYMVTLTVHDVNGCKKSVTKPVTVFPVPTAMFQFNPSCSGQITYFTDFSNGSGFGINGWSWNFGDAASGPDNLSSLQNPTHIYAGPGLYHVTLCVSNTPGCMDCVTQDVTTNPSPVADFAADTVCEGHPTAFTNLSYCIGNNITSWKWDFGDGSPISFLQYPVHTYQVAGNYLVSLTVTTQNGCMATIVKPVTVHENPVADFSYSQPGGQNCFSPGDSTYFTDMSSITGGNLIDHWLWEFGDGETSHQRNPVHLFANPGLHFVTLTVWDINGCSDQIMKQVSLNIQPIAAYTYSISRCDSVCFSDASIGMGDPVQSWFWDFGDPASGIQNHSLDKNPCHIFYTPMTTIYTVTLIVTDSSGCSDTVHHDIIISKPIPDFTFFKACIGEATEFHDLSVSDSNFIASWSWDFGDPGSGSNTSSLEDPIHIYDNVGTYYVTLTVTNGNGCSSMTGKTVVVSYPPDADWSFTVPACYPDPVQFLDNSSPQGSKPIISWYWDFGDGDYSTLQNPVHQFPHAGTYSVSLIINNSDSCQDYHIKPFYYYPSPNAGFSFQPGSVCQGYLVCFDDQSAPSFGNIASWDWDFGDGSPHSTQSEPCHAYLTDGTYTVLLVVSDERGCIDSVTHNLIVHKLPVPDFTADTACLGSVTQFANISNDSTMSWYWNFGEPSSGPENFSTLFEPGHTYLSAGDYWVTLTSTDLNTCQNDTIKKVTVVPLPVVNFTNSNPCSGQPVQFTDESLIFQGSIAGWSWDFGDPLSGPENFSPLQNPLHTYDNPGTYLVTLQVSTTGNCPPVLLTRAVEIRPGPVVEFSWSSSCHGQIVQFSDNTDVNGGTDLVTWKWDFGDPMSGMGDSSALQNPPHLFSGSGDFPVRLIVSNADGCVDTLIKTVTVHPLPGVDFSSASSCQDDTTCFLIDHTVTNTSSIVKYSWDLNGDGIEDTDKAEPCWYYSVPGPVAISLTVTDTNNCSNTRTRLIDVKAKPVADFVPPQIACEGTGVFFNDQSVSSAGYISQWIWSFDDGSADSVITFPSNPDIYHVFPGLGPYSVRLTAVSSLGCRDSVSRLVTLVPGPIAAFIHDSACVEQAVHFTDMSSENGGGVVNSWQWNFGEPSSGVDNSSTQQNPSHDYSTPGNFNVTLIVGSSNGCFDTIVRLVIVNLKPVANFVADTACLGSATHFTDLSVPNATGISIYSWNFGDGSPTDDWPNPSHTYSTSGHFTVTLTLTNSNGCENTFSRQILVLPLPTAAFAFTNPTCQGAEVCFTDHSFTQPGFSEYIKKWIWNFGDGTPPDTVFFPNSPDNCHLFADQNSTHFVKLTVLSSKGCESWIEKTVSTIPAPVSNFSYSAVTCAGQTVYFNDESQPGGGGNVVSWSWNFGDPASGTSNFSTLPDPGHIFSIPGDYQVKLVVVNENNCSDTMQKTVQIGHKPVAAFRADTVCFGTLTRFTDLSIPNADTIIGWSWNFGDNSVIVHERNPQHLYPGYGIYSVTLTVTNSNGCIKDTSMQVLVNPNPAVAFTFTTPICQNQPVCYSDMTTFPPGYLGHVTQWEWNFGDGSDTTIIFPASPSICHIFKENALVHVVRLTVISSDGCLGFIDHTVVSTPAPIANFDYEQIHCEGQPVHFTDFSQLNGGGNIQWLWNFGDPGSGVDNFSTLKNPDHTFSTPGLYSVVLTVTNTSGCFDTITKSIIINAKPVADFIADTACLGTPTNFSDLSIPNATSIVSYSWNFGDGSPEGTQANPEHTYGSYGLFSVTLTIMNSNGCTHSITRQVLVNPLPLAAFTYTSPHCLGSQVCLTDISTTPQGYLGNIVRWFWDFGDGSVQNVKFPANPDVCHMFSGNSLVHNVKLTVITSDSCSHTVEHLINSVPSPVANFSYSAVNCASQVVSFTDQTELNGGGAIISWGWDFGDPASGADNHSTMQNPSHIYGASSSYIVKLIVKNITNCTDTITDTIQINQLPVADFSADTACLGMPTTFTDLSVPNASGIIAWSWNFGDGSPLDPSPDPSHIYNTFGNFTVTLAVTNSNGCTKSISRQILVNPLPVAAFSFSATACQGAPVCYNDESTTPQGYLGRIDTWQWDFGDGSTQPPIVFPNNPDICHTFQDNAQSHVVRLTVTTTDGCLHYTERTVGSSPSPVANFSWNTINCLNTPVQFTDQTQVNGGGPVVSWNWNFGDPGSGSNNSSQQKNPIHAFTGTGPFTVTLIVGNSAGCPDTIQKQITINPLPTADFSADTACVGSQTSFTDESVANSGTITSWLWNFGDGSPANTQKNPKHTYPGYGQYTVNLTVTNSNGCVHSISRMVLVLPLPLPDFTFNSQNCKGAAVSFHDLSATVQGYPGNIKRWKWEFGDGSPSQTIYFPDSPDVIHQFTGNGLSFTVRLTVYTGTPDSCSKYMEHTVTLIPAPLANFTYPVNKCELEAVSFTNQTQLNGGGPVTVWQWNFGDPGSGSNNNSGSKDPLHVFSNGGSFTVTLVATNTGGCSDTIQKTIWISQKPSADFHADSACSGNLTHFTDLSAPADSILSHFWEFGDGGTSTQTDPVHLYALAGNYNVKLTVTSNKGCTKDTTIQVIVHPVPAASFSFSPQNCIADSVQFTDLSTTPGAAIVKWHWAFGDGTDSTIWYPQTPNVRHSYAVSGQYSVTLTVTTADSCSDLQMIPVTITDKPLANFEYELTRCETMPLQFSDLSQATGGIPVVGWMWDFDDPNSGVNNTSTLQNPLHSFTSDGSFNVVLTVTNAGGCTDTITKPVDINAKPTAWFVADTACVGFPTHFSDSSWAGSGTVVAWLWEFDDAQSGSNNTSAEQNPSHTYEIPGTYSVILQVTNSNGCIDDTTLSVHVYPSPEALFSYESSCNGDSTRFTDLSIAPNSQITNWLWDFGDPASGASNSSTNQNPKHAFMTGGTYSVKLVVTNLNGCQDSVIMPVTARPKPVASFTYTSHYCPAGEVSFLDWSQGIGTGIAEWYWIFEPGEVSFKQNPDYVFSKTDTTYLVSLVITDLNGCTDTLTKSVMVKPAFSFGFNYSIECFGHVTTFTPDNIAEGDTLFPVSWNFGDYSTGLNNYSEEYSPTHLFSEPGIFTVKLKVRNSDYCIDSISLPVLVRPNPQAGFTSTIARCDSMMYFTDQSSAPEGTINSWKWNFGDGTPVITINAPPGDTYHLYSSVGEYQVILEVTDNFGCSDTLSATVHRNPCINADFTSQSMVLCTWNEITFTDNSTDSLLIDNWYWDFGDGESMSYTTYTNPVKHIYSNPGDYTVKLVVKAAINGKQFDDSTFTGISVRENVVTHFTISPTCINDSTYFRITSDTTDLGIKSFAWTFGDKYGNGNDTSSHFSPVYLYRHKGEYTTTLIVSDTNGCSFTEKHKIMVARPPVADFSFPDTLCAGTEFQLFNTSTLKDATAFASFLYSFGNARTSAEENPVFKYSKASIYNVRLNITDNAGCKGDTVHTLHVYESPVSSFTMTNELNGISGKIQLNNLSTGAVSYEWDFGNGTRSTEQNPIATYSMDGTYLITLVSRNEYTCTDTTYTKYEVLFKTLYIPNAFSPTNTNMAVRLFKPAGMNMKQFNIQVYDTWGHLLWQSSELDSNGSPIEGWDGTYNGNMMPQGTYMWKASATFIDDTIWQGNDIGVGEPGATMGVVSLIR